MNSSVSGPAFTSVRRTWVPRVTVASGAPASAPASITTPPPSPPPAAELSKLHAASIAATPRRAVPRPTVPSCSVFGRLLQYCVPEHQHVHSCASITIVRLLRRADDRLILVERSVDDDGDPGLPPELLDERVVLGVLVRAHGLQPP